jgi:L-asparagine transporter-like permease
MSSIIDTFNVSDYFFIFLGAFLIAVMISPFLTFPNDAWEMILHFVELYIIVLVVFGCGYGYLKSRSKEMTHLTQEKIYFVFFLILALIVIFLVSNEIMAKRRTDHGFILILIVVVALLILYFTYTAFGAITERYALNQPSLIQMPSNFM